MKISSKLTPARLLVALGVASAAFAAPAAQADQASAVTAVPTAPPGFAVTTFAGLPGDTPAVKGPDDIAQLDSHVFVGWQNGVGPKGEPNTTTGQTDSTVVQYDRRGQTLERWSLTGKVDGIGGDPSHHRLVVTVNEDGNSSLYTITPTARARHQVQHYIYAPAPDSAPAAEC